MLMYAPPRKRFVLAVAALAIFPPFLLTLSRTSYVAFLAMLLVLAWRTRNRALIVLIVAGMLLSPLLMPGLVINRVAYTFNDPIKDAVFGTSTARSGSASTSGTRSTGHAGDPRLGKGVPCTR